MKKLLWALVPAAMIVVAAIVIVSLGASNDAQPIESSEPAQPSIPTVDTEAVESAATVVKGGVIPVEDSPSLIEGAEHYTITEGSSNFGEAFQYYGLYMEDTEILQFARAALEQYCGQDCVDAYTERCATLVTVNGYSRYDVAVNDVLYAVYVNNSDYSDCYVYEEVK